MNAADDWMTTDAVMEQLDNYDIRFDKKLGSQVMTVGMIHLHRIRYPLYIVMSSMLDTMTIMILKQDSGQWPWCRWWCRCSRWLWWRRLLIGCCSWDVCRRLIYDRNYYGWQCLEWEMQIAIQQGGTWDPRIERLRLWSAGSYCYVIAGFLFEWWKEDGVPVAGDGWLLNAKPCLETIRELRGLLWQQQFYVKCQPRIGMSYILQLRWITFEKLEGITCILAFVYAREGQLLDEPAFACMWYNDFETWETCLQWCCETLTFTWDAEVWYLST